MKIMNLILLAILLSLNTILAQETSLSDDALLAEKTYLELPKIEVIPIKDIKQNRQYELFIKLPEGYTDSVNSKYPVIYYTDAMWHVELLSGSAEYMVEEAILVGISWEKELKDALGELGAHASRFRDYSIKGASNPEQQAKYQLGQANNHLTFILNDVIPYIEDNYRTTPDNRTYFGYSLGGEFGAYILLIQPNTFKNYILGSPSLRSDDVAYLSELESKMPSKLGGLHANVFISYGDLEEKSSKHIEAFITFLRNKNDESLSLHRVVTEGSHQTAFPMTVVRSMQWLANLMKAE